MSNISANLLVKGARGKLSNQFVYKTRGDKTFIAKMPVFKENAVPTDLQQKQRELFSEASAYAKGAISSPELKTAYNQRCSGGQTAYNLAFRDYLKASEVELIDVSGYTGFIGSTILIRANDDFRVVSVDVSIHSATGELIEEGAATLNAINREDWIYTAVQMNTNNSGCTIRAMAKDIPGNEGVLEVVLP